MVFCVSEQPVSISYQVLHHQGTHHLDQTDLQMHAETLEPSEHLQKALEEDVSLLEVVLAAPEDRQI